ncbi:hypothetical protein ILYODFUR_028383 [Ilyodon furcidens]|uniref:Uncharacterized protein n=1 Tax=Ilyodon furcidens TaxID=33524 RepID=A0ABV0TMF1_9TELE
MKMKRHLRRKTELAVHTLKCMSKQWIFRETLIISASSSSSLVTLSVCAKRRGKQLSSEAPSQLHTPVSFQSCFTFPPSGVIFHNSKHQSGKSRRVHLLRCWSS